MGFCRFWEYNNNIGYDSGPVDYNCGDAGSTSVNFKVALFTDSNGYHRYGMYDCGTSDWSTCTRESDGPQESNLGNVEIQNAQEAWPVGPGQCPVYFMGSETYQTNMSDMEVQLTEGGGWTTQNFQYQNSGNGQGCGHYESLTHTNTVFKTDDDRNSP